MIRYPFGLWDIASLLSRGHGSRLDQALELAIDGFKPWWHHEHCSSNASDISVDRRSGTANRLEDDFW